MPPPLSAPIYGYDGRSLLRPVFPAPWGTRPAHSPLPAGSNAVTLSPSLTGCQLLLLLLTVVRRVCRTLCPEKLKRGLSEWPLRLAAGAPAPVLGLSSRITRWVVSQTCTEPFSDHVATNCRCVPCATCRDGSLSQSAMTVLHYERLHNYTRVVHTLTLFTAPEC